MAGGGALVASCAPSDIDATTGECSHVVWVEQGVGLPPLTAAEGMQIAAAISACWAIGFLVRLMRKQLGS